MYGDEGAIEFAKLEREAYAKIAVKRAAEQLGECFIGLDRRHDGSAMRGEDRRLAA
jgi:hypothetical protein